MMISDLTVLSARLPYVDRGVLSQAWYDALHFATHRAVPARPAASVASPPNAAPRAQSGARAVAAGHARAASARPAVHTPPPRYFAEPSSQLSHAIRLQAGAMRARLHHAQTAPASAAYSAVVQLAGGERICFIITGGKAGLTFVAMCSPALRARVAYALARVQELFAGSGVACTTHVGELS